MNISKYKFGLRGHDLADNLNEMCISANKYGVENLQFALAKTVSDIDFDKIGYDEAIAAKIADKLKAHGLSVSVLGCYINPVDTNEERRAAALKRFKNFILYAKAFGARVIGTETGSIGSLELTRSEENYRSFIRDFTPIVRFAEKHGVTVAIEPVYSFTIYSAEIMARMISDISSDNLAVIFDPSNIITADNYQNQTQIIDGFFDLLGEKIQAVHIKDFDIKDGAKAFAPAGHGLLDIKHLFKRIERLPQIPELILDELPAIQYTDALKALASI